MTTPRFFAIARSMSSVMLRGAPVTARADEVRRDRSCTRVARADSWLSKLDQRARTWVESDGIGSVRLPAGP